jgi:hypothetical protein
LTAGARTRGPRRGGASERLRVADTRAAMKPPMLVSTVGGPVVFRPETGLVEGRFRR